MSPALEFEWCVTQSQLDAVMVKPKLVRKRWASFCLIHWNACNRGLHHCVSSPTILRPPFHEEVKLVLVKRPPGKAPELTEKERYKGESRPRGSDPSFQTPNVSAAVAKWLKPKKRLQNHPEISSVAFLPSHWPTETKRGSEHHFKPLSSGVIYYTAAGVGTEGKTVPNKSGSIRMQSLLHNHPVSCLQKHAQCLPQIPLSMFPFGDA